MNNGAAVAVALVFVWVGMVLGISFLEAPLKFRAPGVTLSIGLGIGRLVFRALNAVEVVLAAGIAVALAVGDAGEWVAFLVAAVALVVQLFAVRPALTRRTNAVLEGLDAPRSRAHFAYIGLEVVKVVALVVAGVVLLSV
ncbi:hypothetical protein ACIA5D_38015 [Actinoplanes sp. NPDC051513]|uniref:hypothetical protein n=1 Tax=Actinoplanes sp. NPDC051513 TaxID=3363908 RepID=UPI0037959424